VSGNTIERLLDRIDAELSDHLIFAGILDTNAKLISFRRGRASFSLPLERQDTLDVQVSLMFSLICQLEDISGSHKFTATRFAKHDIFLFGTPELHIFVITMPTSQEQVAKTLVDLVGGIIDNIEAPSPPTKKASPALLAKMNEQTRTTTMTTSPIQREEASPSSKDRQRFSSPSSFRSRPEAILMMQGYIMALEEGLAIEEDVDNFYKLKADDAKFDWSMIEKIKASFGDRISIHQVAIDTDGRLAVRISTK
jgi:hypothetical protein